MLTLIVPGLIWPRQALADLTHDLPLPAFTTLLGRGRLTPSPAQDATAMLAASAGLEGPLPAAALRLLALRGETDAADWLCLDPVRLHFHERSLIVEDARHLQLSDAEAAELAVSLAPTLAALGELEVLAPDMWNLRLAAAAPSFPDLRQAAGRSAAPLPAGAAYAPWRHALNETQMILHAHPVNRAREAAARPLVNSLWPWGGGRLPQSAASPHRVLWSSDPVARGIARLLRIEHAALPPGFDAARGEAPLAIIDALDGPARSGDAMLWRDELARFEVEWLAPVLNALRAGRLAGLRLLAPDSHGSVELQVARRDMWRFWRKPRTLADALTGTGPT